MVRVARIIKMYMKKFIFGLILFASTQTAFSQVSSFYKGEWAMTDKNDLFTCYCKLEILPGAAARLEFIWTFLATDSSNQDMMTYYKGKKGKTGIEFTKGTYTAATNDVFLSSTDMVDPESILGKGKYYLKISADRQVIYGSTASPEGTDPGLFYAVKIAMSNAEFEGMKSKIK